MTKFKNFIKQILPPFITSFIIKLKSEKLVSIQKPHNQSLDIYYDEKMAKILENWGKRNTWLEIQHLLLDKKGKILDIACGTGTVIEILNNNGQQNIFGCDISDFLINKAIERGISEDKLKVCDATNMPYEDDFFDYSYSIGSLEHFTEDQIIEFLKSARRVTKYFSFHQIPMSKSDKNEGWISPLQSYFNNSKQWWIDKCNKVYDDVKIIDSSWEDKRSIGRWLILKK